MKDRITVSIRPGLTKDLATLGHQLGTSRSETVERILEQAVPHYIKRKSRAIAEISIDMAKRLAQTEAP